MAMVAVNNNTNVRPTLEDMQAYVKRLEKEVIAKVDGLKGIG